MTTTDKINLYLANINALFEEIYGEKTLISTILKKTGLPAKSIKKIQEENIKQFLNNFYINFDNFLKTELPSRNYKIISGLYGLTEENETKLAKKLDLEIPQMRTLKKKSINTLKEEVRIRKIEGIIVKAAQNVLN